MDQLELLVAQLMIGYKRIANPSFNESCGPSLSASLGFISSSSSSSKAAC